MTKRGLDWRWSYLLAVGGFVVLGWLIFKERGESRALPSLPAKFAAAVPLRVVWAWEVAEDLRALPDTVGVAYLAETLYLSDQVRVEPRRVALLTAPGARVVAVVRVEATSRFVDSSALRETMARQLLRLMQERPGAALQVDFDAVESQREFYGEVLRRVRQELPRDKALSITALVSWCGPRSWLRGLPIDEAVPMFFRMGGRRELAGRSAGGYRLIEPLCRSSIGVSTDERWPTMGEDRLASRLYVFAPQAWRPEQLRAVAETPLSLLGQELAR